LSRIGTIKPSQWGYGSARCGIGRRGDGQKHEEGENEISTLETNVAVSAASTLLVDTPRERQFDLLVELAAEVCEAPIAWIGVLTEDRQWFKASRGLGMAETTREDSLCSRVPFADGTPFVTADAAADDRLSDSPLVAGEPGIRMYARVPVGGPDGRPAGTLCVGDTGPRTLEPGQLARLEELASLASDLIAQRAQDDELRLTRKRLADDERLAHVGSFTWDVATDNAEWSPELMRILGVDEDAERSFDGFMALIHPDDRERVRRIGMNGLETASDVRYRARIVRPDGEVRVTETHAEPQLGPDGEVHQFVGATVDVTELVEAERTSRDRARAFEAAFDSSLDAMFVVDDDRRYSDVNESACRLLDYSREELIGMRVDDFVPQRHWPTLDASWREFLDQGRHRGEVVLRRRDGGLIIGEYSATAAFAPGRHLTVMRDVTERRAAERETAEAKRRLEETQAMARVGSWEWDVNTGRVTATPELKEMLGLRPDEDVPHSREFNERLVHPDDRERVWAAVERSLSDGTDFRETYRIIRPDGEVRAMESHGRLLFGEDGTPTRMLGAIQDVTEARRREDGLRFQASVLDQIRAGVIASDSNRKITLWSRGAEELFGISQEEALGKTVDETYIVHPESAVVRRRMMERLASGKPWEGELMGQRHDGEPLRVYVTNAPVHGDEGRIVGYAGVVVDISEQKRVEERVLLQSQLLDQVEAAVVGVDKERRVTVWNDGAERIYGWRRGEAMGRKTRDLGMVPEESADTVREARATTAAGRTWNGEMRMLNSHGEAVDVYVTNSPVRNARGEIAGYVAVSVDLTEKKEAEREVAAARRLLQTFIDSSPAAIYLKDRDLRYVLVNDEFERIFGARRDRLIGQTDAQAYPDVDLDQVGTIDRLILSKGETVTREEKMNLGGIERILLNQKFPVYDAEGQVTGVGGVITDVTFRKRTEAELRRRANEQAAVAALGRQALGEPDVENLSADAVWTVAELLDVDLVKVLELRPDRSEFVLRAARGFRETEGVSEVVPWAGSQAGFTVESQAPVVVEDYEQETRFEATALLREHGARSGVSVVIEGSDGPYGILSAYTVESRRFGEDDVMFLQSVANVLAAAIAHQRAAQLSSQLETTQRLEAVGKLAGGIAHDFNNLLSVILNYADFVIEELPEGSTRQDVTEIKSAAERAATLTHQLLVFSRREVVVTEPIDLSRVISDTEELLRRTLEEHISLVTNCQSRLWPVELGAGQAEQVLLNLTVNGRDAIGERGGTIEVKTENLELDREIQTSGGMTLEEGRYVRLTVADDGCGMAREVADQAFDPFFTTKPKGEGTGLGLATVYGIVRQAGGDVEIYSEEGRGTAVKVYLPAVVDPAASARPEREDGPRLGNGELVLLVEDEDAVRSLAQRILSSNGYRVEAARDGREAEELASRLGDEVDLLLSDVVMPQISGPALVERLRSSRPGLRALFMSGYTGEVIERHGVTEHGVPLLEKPFSGESLLRAVRETLDPDD
jgi:two-component system, cell cycle sensor histidine kinase and response regulator CckA